MPFDSDIAEEILECRTARPVFVDEGRILYDRTHTWVKRIDASGRDEMYCVHCTLSFVGDQMAKASVAVLVAGDVAKSEEKNRRSTSLMRTGLKVVPLSTTPVISPTNRATKAV